MGARPLVTVLVATLLLAACSTSDGGGEPSPEPTEQRTAADERADLTVLPVDALPEGWVRVPARQRIDGRPGTPKYCGVVAEPDPVEEGRISFYEQESLPRQVLEYGMLSTTEGATATLDALEAVRESCTEPDHDVTPVPAEELEGIGDQVVAWDFVRSDDESVRFRALVLRRDDTVVVLVATGPAGVPAEQQLQIARAVDERLVG